MPGAVPGARKTFLLAQASLRQHGAFFAARGCRRAPCAVVLSGGAVYALENASPAQFNDFLRRVGRGEALKHRNEQLALDLAQGAAARGYRAGLALLAADLAYQQLAGAVVCTGACLVVALLVFVVVRFLSERGRGGVEVPQGPAVASDVAAVAAEA